ncbi:ABC transporter ATP-binding protein [Kitasatospora sp. NPDC057015]|uniref:ABC transporter ATP-binding protein n=1 Tax=Kitasatospora sp. NPDC057015 TaxID=3346001 RepID=UPI0036394109
MAHGASALGGAAPEEIAFDKPVRRGEPILEVRDLVKHFPLTKGILFKKQVGAVKAVDGITFDLVQGETLGIVGESGCGKSTLAKVLMNLEPASAGSVRFKGEEISHLSGAGLKAVRRNIQMVFQDPYTSLNPRMTVGDIIGEPYEIHPEVAPKGSRAKAVRDLLDVVGLNPEYINRYPHQFSGGQRQRIGIARGLALKPEVIICDEPVSALDVSVQAQVINLLEQLQTEFNLSYMFIAHDLSIVRHISDRVGVMYLGKMVEIGTDLEIYDHATHPYTQALLSAVPVPDPVAREARDRIVLTGDVPSPANPPSGCRFRTRCWKAQERCATEVPLLAAPSWLTGLSKHESACHFAAERDNERSAAERDIERSAAERDIERSAAEREVERSAAEREAESGTGPQVGRPEGGAGPEAAGPQAAGPGAGGSTRGPEGGENDLTPPD